jgi:hypothetical protein
MNFGLIINKNYISRAIVMIDSLNNVLKETIPKIFLLAIDNETHSFFSEKSDITLISLDEIENKFPMLKSIKTTRSDIEYIFTLSPVLPLYILIEYNDIDRITTLDADLYFYSSPYGIIKSLGFEKIGITQHNFSDDLKELERFGRYNVSFQSFPNTVESINCLNEWAERCFEFCGDYFDETGRYADQKYLDEISIKYKSIISFPFPDIGLAPWNIKKFDLKFINRKIQESDNMVIFYHFQSLRIRSSFHSAPGFEIYNFLYPSKPVKKFYFEYIKKLRKADNKTDWGISRSNNPIDSSYVITFMNDLRKRPIIIHQWPFMVYLNIPASNNVIVKSLRNIFRIFKPRPRIETSKESS